MSNTMVSVGLLGSFVHKYMGNGKYKNMICMYVCTYMYVDVHTYVDFGVCVNITIKSIVLQFGRIYCIITATG